MAEKTDIRVINLSEVIKDIDDFDGKTQVDFEKMLDRYAKQVAINQKTILRQKVKQWTGNLAGSIGFSASKLARTIYPGRYYIPRGKETGEDYRLFIEEGGQPYNNPKAKPFMGYWYVKDSIKGIEEKMKKEINQIIKKNQKK